MGEILKRVLALAGIYTDKEPILTIWSDSRQMTIKSFDVAIRCLMGMHGLYEVAVENPTIVGIDPKPFKINYMYILCRYDREGWGEPSVWTDEEEYETTTTPEQLRDRAIRMGKKAKEILELLLALREISKLLGFPVP